MKDSSHVVVGFLAVGLVASAGAYLLLTESQTELPPSSVAAGAEAIIEANTPIAASVAFTTPVAPTHREHVPIPIAYEDQDLVEAASMTKDDQRRLQCVNVALKRAGLAAVEVNRVKLSNLEAARQIIDAAEKSVGKAEDAWLGAASTLTHKLHQVLMADLARGVQDGLPEQSKSNPFMRRHPHEAISQVSYNGKAYVLRVSPQEAPALATKGSAYEEQVTRRVFDYDTLVRPLLHAHFGK